MKENKLNLDNNTAQKGIEFTDAEKEIIGFLVDKKRSSTEWVVKSGKSDNPKMLEDKLIIYASILRKINYTPKPKPIHEDEGY